MERADSPQDMVHVLVITGPVGVGKTTVARAIAEELEQRDTPYALLDMDYLGWVHPPPARDASRPRLGFGNLAMIWPNLQEAGARWVVMADIIQHSDGAQPYRDAIPGSCVTVVRLNAPLDLVRQRLEQREGAVSREWYVNRAFELQGIMEREGVGDLVVEVGERSPEDVAHEILARYGQVWAGMCQPAVE